VGLVAAFWPWLKVLRSIAVPFAALLFATNWMAIYYGNGVQPNIYVALGAVGAVGLFLRATYGDNADRRLRVLLALAGALFFIGLVRPSDALLVAAPLGLACLVVPSTRRPIVAPFVAAGVFGGWLTWIIEAYQRFGGPLNRYRLSSAHDAVGGLHLNLHTATVYARILDGPFYAGGQYGSPGPYSAVWLAAVAIATSCVIVGLVAAVRSRTLMPIALGLAVAMTLSLLYIFLLGYAAVRFLVPIVALICIPAAFGLVWLARRRRPTSKAVVVAALVVLMAAELGLQLRTLHYHVMRDRPTRAAFEATGLALPRVGLQQPCVVIGSIDPAPVAYWAHCLGGGQTTGAFGPLLVQQAQRYLARGLQVALITHAKELPAYFSTWIHKTDLPGVRDHTVQAWLSPPVAHAG
jgi:hypothetical protein